MLAGRADEAVRRVPRDLGSAWYRGWMIPAAASADLDAALAVRRIRLEDTLAGGIVLRAYAPRAPPCASLVPRKRRRR